MEVLRITSANYSKDQQVPDWGISSLNDQKVPFTKGRVPFIGNEGIGLTGARIQSSSGRGLPFPHGSDGERIRGMEDGEFPLPSREEREGFQIASVDENEINYLDNIIWKLKEMESKMGMEKLDLMEMEKLDLMEIESEPEPNKVELMEMENSNEPEPNNVELLEMEKFNPIMENSNETNSNASNEIQEESNPKESNPEEIQDSYPTEIHVFVFQNDQTQEESNPEEIQETQKESNPDEIQNELQESNESELFFETSQSGLFFEPSQSGLFLEPRQGGLLLENQQSPPKPIYYVVHRKQTLDEFMDDEFSQFSQIEEDDRLFPEAIIENTEEISNTEELENTEEISNSKENEKEDIFHIGGSDYFVKDDEELDHLAFQTGDENLDDVIDEPFQQNGNEEISQFPLEQNRTEEISKVRFQQNGNKEILQVNFVENRFDETFEENGNDEIFEQNGNKENCPVFEKLTDPLSLEEFPTKEETDWTRQKINEIMSRMEVKVSRKSKGNSKQLNLPKQLNLSKETNENLAKQIKANFKQIKANSKGNPKQLKGILRKFNEVQNREKKLTKNQMKKQVQFNKETKVPEFAMLQMGGSIPKQYRLNQKYFTRQARLNSFENPQARELFGIQIQELAEAGFFYRSKYQWAQCCLCRLVFRDYYNSPFKFHLENNSKCLFLKATLPPSVFNVLFETYGKV